MDVLLLRFDAPLMSFGGVMVDQHGPTDRFPGLSLLAGLFGNALGYTHRDAGALEALQERIEYAARWDLEPQEVVDYHTVDLGQPKMSEAGWTTRGEPEHRTGGAAAALGIHQRYRRYWADGVMTLAVTLRDAEPPSLEQLAEALGRPARPLFLGRKTCLPATPLVLGFGKAPDIVQALRQASPAARPDRIPARKMRATWPMAFGPVGLSSGSVAVYDRRNWHNQVHTGRRLRMEGWLDVEAP